MTKSIAVVGAGAKAAAIAARAAALKPLLTKGSVPDIHIFEKDHVGAAWSGKGMFSSGFLTLCTPGEKDVGFPYNEVRRDRTVSAPVSPALFARFSWAAYQVAAGRMADWVDRGREHPLHRQWAHYLQWVFDQANQWVIPAQVLDIRPNGSGWTVRYDDPAGPQKLDVDGVVLTGAGQPKTVPRLKGIPRGRIFDSETFWRSRDKLQRLDKGVIAVAGDGGSAGTIAAWLAERHAETSVTIASISGMGTLFPRGDGHAERRWFSDPSEWAELHEGDRRKLVDRTEAGVVAMSVKRQIDRSGNVKYYRGKAEAVRWDNGESALDIDVRYRDKVRPLTADYLISAIGFDSWSTLRLVRHPQVDVLRNPRRHSERTSALNDIQGDLSLPPVLGFPAGLHVPAMAGFARGPGMGNLGCLGLMAKAVLDPYL